MNQDALCLTGKSVQKSVHPFPQKYSARAVGQISDLTPRVSRQMRGDRDRHERAVGCGGRESCD